MGCRRSLGRRVALGCGGLIGLVIILVVAAYLILQAVGARQVNAAVARIKASGAPTTWEEAIPPPVPDDQNAALLYEKAFAAITLDKVQTKPRPRYPPYPYPPEKKRTHPQRVALGNYMAAATSQKRRPLENAARKILADNARALSYARQAVKRPKCRFNRNWDDPLWMLTPELSRLKDLSRLTSVRAVLQADRGDLAGALDSWPINLSIANHLEGDPSLLGQLTRYSVLHVATASLRGILQDDGLSREQCLDLARGLGRVNIGQAFIKCFEAERSSSLSTLDYLRKKPLWTLDYVRKKPQGLASYASLWYRAVGPFDQAAMLRYWEKQIALARRPYRESSSRFDALSDDIPGYALFTRALEPSFGRAVGARDGAIAEVGLMRIGLGLGAYRTECGEYPDSLDGLRRALKWDVPEDPFSGKDFVYRREGAGDLLYSIGPDLKDNGGAPMTTTKKPPIARVGDIVWRMER